MAMDKEQLLCWFQTHYLSRQDVLYKLPLNLSIDSFWAELLNRRKAGATVLPLYNASGMPYWYVLTERMIVASERLCEEAMSLDGAFDPYRAQMTSAMTEEMFFTSFVEGAQIPLQQAMDFLQRGTEPEDIQEQMIWNNRHAWAEMTAMLYHPLDEEFIKALAFMLTEEMDGCAQDYRQADYHPIAVMGSEPYDIPPSYTLPDRMREYCAFLGQSDIHPLIKSAVAQAFILVTRPFPEGNERLSRMLSSAVLLRCGYDFFRDISLSAVIAKESYRYYKSMKEILRPDNCGDLTYFVEYFIELLVRAVDTRKERLRRQEQDALEKEREMARLPLQAAMAESKSDTFVSTHDAKEEKAQADPSTRVGDKLVIGRHMPIDKFLGLVDQLKQSNSNRVKTIPRTVRTMIKANVLTFTIRQWSQYSGLSHEASDQQCRILFKKELLDRDKRGKAMTYTFRVIVTSPDRHSNRDETGEKPASIETGREPMPEELMVKLDIMKMSRYGTMQQGAETICRLYANNEMLFARRDFSKLSGLNNQQADKVCETMLRMGIIRNRWPDRKPAFYEIVLDHTEKEPLSPGIIQQLQKMRDDGESHRDNRIGEFLLKLISSGRHMFTSADWEKAYNLPSHIFGEDIRMAMNLGLIRKNSANGVNIRCIYTICSTNTAKIHTNDLTTSQKHRLTRLYDAFGKEKFSIESCAKLFDVTGSAARSLLNALKIRGILKMQNRQDGVHVYSFATIPKQCSDCFKPLSVESRSRKSSPKAATGMKSAIAMAV